MENEIEIVRLLTEIRDNQHRQLDAHQTSQREYVEFYKAAVAKQGRRALIVAVVVALGVAMILFGVMSK